MSEAKEIVEATGAEVAKFAIDKLDSYFMAAQEVITKYGGDAVDLGLMALRVDAASHLIIGLLLLALLWPWIYVIKKAAVSEMDKSRDCVATVIIGGTLSIIYLGVMIGSLSDLWAWVGIFYPEVYAVHKFLL